MLTSKVFSLPFSKQLGLVLTLVAGAQESGWMCTGPLEAEAQLRTEITEQCYDQSKAKAKRQTLGLRGRSWKVLSPTGWTERGVETETFLQ